MERLGKPKKKTREAVSNCTIPKKPRTVTASKELESTTAWAPKLADTDLSQSKVSNACGNFYDNGKRREFQAGQVKFCIEKWKKIT